jgi:HAE1 family hydrophobic/amphiphilic exporter-1
MLSLLFRKSTGLLLLTAMLIALGILLVAQLPIQLYPQTQRPRVRATINHTGISAVDFADEYADTIESRLLAIEGIDLLEVVYENDRSSFTLTFDWETEPEDAKAEVDTTMTAVDALLPARIRDSYRVSFFSGENAGYLIIGVTAPSAAPEELFAALDSSVRPRLNGVEDAESIDIYAVEELNVEVVLRQDALLANGLTILDIEAALRDAVANRSVGSLDEGDRSFTVRYRRGSDALHALPGLEVAERGDRRIRLEDVADVSIRYDLPSRVFLMGGRRGIQITATPIDGGNVRRMSEEVMNVLEESRSARLVPEDTVFQVYLDPADYINRSVRNVVQAALLGALLAMIVVFLGLGEWHNTVLIGLSLPTTIVLSFILMHFFEVSLNLISLGGIALAVGMVIDSSIVVIENIHRLRLAEAPIGSPARLREVIIEAVNEVRVPVIASTLTSVLVFLPISFTAPLTSAILGDQARTVVFALLIAMVVALTLLPVIAYLMFHRHIHAGESFTGFQRLSHRGMEFFRRRYKAALTGMLRHWWISALALAVSVGLLIASILVILPLIPREIVSAPSSDRIVVFFGNSRIQDRTEIIDVIVPRMEREIEEAVGIHVVDTYADIMGRFNRLFINLESSLVADEVLGSLQERFQSDGEWYYNVMAWDPAQLPLPRTMDLQISVSGDDATQAVRILEQLREIVADSELYAWSFTNPSTSFSDDLELVARPAMIGSVPGYSESQLLSLVTTVLGGTGSYEYREGTSAVSVRAEYPEDEIDSRFALENFLVPFESSAIPLKHFFDFSESTGVSGIASEDGERVYRLYARMTPGTPASERDIREEQVREIISSGLTLPPGYSLTFDNPQEELDAAIRSLFLALGASIALIYLLLAFQFNSLRVPLVILVTVPLGFIGVVASLYLFKSTLSLNSMLGTILLGGIVVNNAIILLDFYLRLRPRYPDRITAIVESAGLRFVPIMMTMLTTVFGMLPIAIGMGEGSNIVQPLGIAVSGGLVVSTLFTLFLVPGILSFMELDQ